MYAINGATGQLGRFVIDALLRTAPADQIVARIHNVAKAGELAERELVVREAEYNCHPQPRDHPGVRMTYFITMDHHAPAIEGFQKQMNAGITASGGRLSGMECCCMTQHPPLSTQGSYHRLPEWYSSSLRLLSR